MSIFGTIMSKIFGTHAQAAPASGAAGSSATSGAATGGGSGAPAGTSSSPTSAGAGSSTASASASSGTSSQVDVGKVLGDMAAKNSEKLDWKHSIVDLMKLLGMDSSLTARKELAKELNYTGDTNDSATMNMWLSKQVMQKLAENGGKLPDDLKHA